MNQNLLLANQKGITKMKEMLDQLEVELLQFRLDEGMVHEIMEVGYWANELLQSRVSYEERQVLIGLVERVKYLQMMYLESTCDERAHQLSTELKDQISEEAWRTYLRLDEINGLEREFFQNRHLHKDYNLQLLSLEQELLTRLAALKMRIH